MDSICEGRKETRTRLLDWNKSLDSIRQEKFVSQDRRRHDRIAVKKERMTVDDRRTRQKSTVG